VTTAVVDTNVLASGIARATYGPPARIIDAWLLMRFDLFVSDHILTELARTLRAPYFLSRVAPETRQRSLWLLEHRATRVALDIEVSGVATQAKDDPVLATALNAKADYLVTGDAALLRLGTFEGTRIVSAAGFVEILAAEAREAT
jgi:putative PIN family toxin of toxin-antitoxin system